MTTGLDIVLGILLLTIGFVGGIYYLKKISSEEWEDDDIDSEDYEVKKYDE